MTQIADVVIIGSGALGCAVAYCLTESGVRRISVVDRGPLVSGMTRRHAGLLHTHYAEPALMRLAAQSIDTYRHWATGIGGTCGFNETGTIVIASSEEGAQLLRRRAEIQQSIGVPVQLLKPAELAALFSRASFKDVVLAVYEPESGYVDAVLAAQGFARRAREKGVVFQTGTLVKQIGQERGRITQVVTTTGNIQTPLVIVAAGAGAERLLMPLGFMLNLQSTRGVIGFFEQPPALHEGHPTIVDVDSSSFIRPHAFHLSTAGIVNGHARIRPSESLDETLSGEETKGLTEFAVRRLPDLEEAPLRRSHAILYDYLADRHPGLGAVPGFEGLYLIAGFGESAIAAAPAVGHAIAELIVDGRSSTDVSEFRPARPGLTHPSTKP